MGRRGFLRASVLLLVLVPFVAVMGCSALKQCWDDLSTAVVTIGRGVTTPGPVSPPKENPSPAK